MQEYRIWIKFSNGETGEADLKNLIFKFPTAAPLKDIQKFAQFHLDGWPTLAWECGFDVDPEYLYTLVTGKPAQETQQVFQTTVF